MDLVSVGISTLDRPDRLRRALASVLPQQSLDVAVEIVVVDDSTQGSAIATLVGRGVRAVHTPAPGFANAQKRPQGAGGDP